MFRKMNQPYNRLLMEQHSYQSSKKKLKLASSKQPTEHDISIRSLENTGR
jgi:hypothetical protein